MIVFAVGCYPAQFDGNGRRIVGRSDLAPHALGAEDVAATAVAATRQEVEHESVADVDHEHIAGGFVGPDVAVVDLTCMATAVEVAVARRLGMGTGTIVLETVVVGSLHGLRETRRLVWVVQDATDLGRCGC